MAIAKDSLPSWSFFPPWFKDEADQQQLIEHAQSIQIPDMLVSLNDYSTFRIIPIFPFVLLIYFLAHIFSIRASREVKEKSSCSQREYSLDLHNYCVEDASANGECPICICEFEFGDEVTLLNCKHSFHRVCIEKWIHEGQTQDKQCPICKASIFDTKK